MSDLPSSATRRPSRRTVPKSRRPLAAAAAAAGVMSSTGVLVGLMAVGLVGWLASDAGGYGDSRDALRVGADAWLLGHGSGLRLQSAEISVVPLGVTAFCGYVVYRLARWAGNTSVVDGRRTALTGAVVLAGVYASVATLTAVLASVGPAEPHPGRAFLGGFLVAFVSGGLGILLASRVWAGWRSTVPRWLLAVGTGASSVVLLMLAASSLLLLVALLLDFGKGANVLALLHLDAPDGLLYSLVVGCFVPNATLLSGAYLLGPGFTVGTGTLVSPTSVVLGPVPAFPLVAALPDDGATPWWTILLMGVPVAVAAAATVLTQRRYPVDQYEQGALRGLAIGVAGGLTFALLASLAGGSAGPGRMADVGADLGRTAVAAGVAMGAGAMIGAVWATWRARRPESDEPPGAARRPRRRPRPAGSGPGR